MVAQQIIPITASVETEITKSPFLPQNATNYQSVAGGTVYGVYLPGRDARLLNYQEWTGDGVKTIWTELEIVNLANADTTAAPSDANKLTVVATVNGVVQKRIAVAGAPAAGEYEVFDNGGTTQIEFGTAPVDGAKVEVFLILLADINSVVVTAGAIPVQGPAFQVVNADAAVTITRVTQ